MKQAETQRGHGETRGQADSPTETKPGKAGTRISVSQLGGALAGAVPGNQGHDLYFGPISLLWSSLPLGRRSVLMFLQPN